MFFAFPTAPLKSSCITNETSPPTQSHAAKSELCTEFKIKTNQAQSKRESFELSQISCRFSSKGSKVSLYRISLGVIIMLSICLTEFTALPSFWNTKYRGVFKTYVMCTRCWHCRLQSCKPSSWYHIPISVTERLTWGIFGLIAALFRLKMKSANTIQA